MVRLSLVVCILSVAIASSTACADPKPIVLKKGDRIVFLGDSITAGGNSAKDTFR